MPKSGAASAAVKAHGGHTAAAQSGASAVTATASTAAAAPVAVGSSGAAPARSKWERTFSNGDTYSGEALYVNDKDRKPVKDGKGRYTWAASGAVYEGDWKAGQPHGSGSMRLPGADGYEYTGAFKDGKRSGSGRCQFANGRVYDGEWRSDEMNGTGTLRGATNVDDFVEYTGGFQEGKRSGPRGRCVYANGDIYEGAWASGKRQGFGDWQLHRPATGAASTRPVRYRGPFDRDVPQACTTGEAEIEYADGSSYTGGTDANMRRSGKGVHRLASGDTFDGVFVQDRREGLGMLQGQDGAVCEGPWRSDQLDGDVRVTFAAASSTSLLGSRLAKDEASLYAAPTSSASLANMLRLNQPEHAAHPMATYQGPCVAGIFTGGRAVITYVDGSSYTGAVRNGVPHGPGLLRDRPLLLSPSAAGIDAVDGVVCRRIPVSCVPADVQLTLTCYDGGFSNGEADGTGTGEWRAVAPAQAGRPAVDAPVTPETFMRVLVGGLRCWDAAALYGCLDGTYTGQWVRGLPHGQGTWQWADGSRYSGAVAHYVPSGAGTLTCGASVQYTGDLREGLAEGNGTWESRARGLRYEGQWLAGKPHGTGVATVTGGGAVTATVSKPPHALSPCTRVYDGMWADGRPSGQGREYADADRRVALYEGSYADGCREGEGTAVLDGAGGGPYVQYKGAFRGGAPGGGGAGCLTLRNKTTVEGSFDAELLPVAHTEVVIKAGNEAWVFKGTYDAAAHTGRGTMSFATGDTYDGEVEDASCSGSGAPPQQRQQQQPLYALQRHGRGTYKFIEGNRLVCTWRHNILHGAGTYTTAEGVQTERKYADGVLTGDMPAAAGSTGGGGARRSSEARVEPDTGAVMGNVFTPENEFPNTLSEEAIKARMPEQPTPTPAQSRKRQPFAFMRKGEARQASSVATAAAAASPAGAEVAAEGPSAPAPAQRTSPHRDAKDGKRPNAPAASGGAAPAASASTYLKRRSPRPSVTGTGAPNGGASEARKGAALAVVGSSTSAASPSHATPKYSLRRPQPSPDGGGGGATSPPATDPARGSTGSSSSPAVSGRLSYIRRAKESGGGGASGTGAPSSSSQSAYLSRFQAGIRQLDVEARANSPAPSTASRSPTPTTTSGGAGFPVTSPAQPGSRGRLSSALAAGRAQADLAAPPQRSLQPLKGSLKDLMDAASAIRSTREDEIHLLTEEMRCLNERIWQLRFSLAARGDGGGTKGGPSARRAAPVYGKAKEEKRASASKEALAAIVQERRVIMEKLQYVVNEPED